MTARLWDLGAGTCTTTLEGHRGGVFCVAFHPTAYPDLVLTGSSDKTLKLWSCAEAECIDTLTGHAGAVSSLAFHPLDSEVVASASYDDTVRLSG